MIQKFFITLRNFPPTNRLIRLVLRAALKIGKLAEKLTIKFRIYGKIKLTIEDVSIHVRARADEFMANEIYYGVGESYSEFKMVRHLSPHLDWFIEVGAYTGISSLFAARSNPKTNVITVEPNPKNFNRIAENVALNNLGNIFLEPFAIGHEASRQTFNFSKDEPLSAIGSMNKDFAQYFSGGTLETVVVEVQTLDALIKKHQIQPSKIFIKIDVEYYELNVLRGAIQTLQQLKPIIMLEIILYERLIYYRPEMKGRIDESHVPEIEKLLFSLGYRPYLILRDGLYRIDSVFNAPDSRDVIFAPVQIAERFVPFDKMEMLFV
jgi:FkbM family methyltransferase